MIQQAGVVVLLAADAGFGEPARAVAGCPRISAQRPRAWASHINASGGAVTGVAS